MSNIILELRQKDTDSVNANGDYETYLGRDIVIEEGDLVQLKNAWVDTVQEGTITIPEDLTLTTNYCLYFTDFNTGYTPTFDEENKKAYVLENNSPNLNTFNGDKYIPYSIKENGTSGLEVYQGYLFKTLENTPYTKSPFTATYQYVNAQYQTITFHTSVPVFLQTPQGYTDSFNVVCQPNTLKLTHPETDSLNDLWVQALGPISGGSLVNVLAEPMIFTNSFQLPAGNYSANQLGIFISETMTTNRPNASSNSIVNPYMKNSLMFEAGQPYPNGTLNPNGTPAIIPEIDPISKIGTYFFNSDLTCRMNFVLGGFTNNGTLVKWLIGTSQIQLAFDAETQKFSWQYLHFPMYDLTGANMSVRYIQYYENGLVNKIYSCANSGGIFFTGLDATVTATGKHYAFWDDVLGFDLATLCAPKNKLIAGTNTQTIFGINGVVTGYTLSLGQNITDGFVGTDSAIIKNDLFFLQQPAFKTASTINSTIPINAAFSQNQLLDYYSHFILECDLNFVSNYVGASAMRKVQGTISKFQNYGSYTYGETDGSIQYVHHGASIIMRSVKVRILKSDKTLDPNLGDDNTIIFQVIKNTPPAPEKK